MMRFSTVLKLPSGLAGIVAGGAAATVLVGVLAPTTDTGPGAAPVASAAQRDVYQALEVFHGALMLVREQYLEPVEAEMLMDGAIRGIFDALDDDSTYFSAEEAEQYRGRDAAPASIGIGLEKRYYIHVDDVLPGSPAEAAGLEPGAAIVSIDGHTTRDLRVPAARLRLDGAVGTPVELEIRNEADAESETVTVTRSVLDPAPAEAQLDDSGVGVLRIRRFHEGTPAQLAEAVESFRAGGASGVLLDLRESRGDGVDCGAGAAAAAAFTGGTAAQLAHRGPGGDEEKTPVPVPDPRPASSWDGPLVVLIAEGTVCPGEVLAGALAERPGTALLGRRTAGRTGVPRLIELPEGDALLISSSHYQTPEGEDILGTGLSPTRTVTELEEELDLRFSDLDEDRPLEDLGERWLLHQSRNEAEGPA